MGVHLGGDSKGGGRFQDDGGVNLANSEHGRAVHCYAIASGSVWRYGEDTRRMGWYAVVGAGGYQPGGGKGDRDGGGGGGRG